jgi:hypothetical protein
MDWIGFRFLRGRWHHFGEWDGYAGRFFVMLLYGMEGVLTCGRARNCRSAESKDCERTKSFNRFDNG